MNASNNPTEIRSYTFGNLARGNRSYTSDVILFPDRVLENWRRSKGHLLQRNDLSLLKKGSFDVLLIGTGAHGVMRVAHEVEAWLDGEGISWEAHPTAKACERYNQLVRKRKRVVAALHLTC